MENIIHIIGELGGVVGLVWAICWLINKKDERNFCKKENEEANRRYLDLEKVKKRK